jgi:thiamine-phosphate diphosphorylase
MAEIPLPTPRAEDRLRDRWPRRPLMLVTDRRRSGDRPLAAVVDEAIEGGVNIVQLREKDLPAGELLTLARQLRGVCGHRALLFVNDRLDVALLSGADGVHLGEESLPVAAVRRLIPATMFVGRSVHTVNAARQAELDGADYLVAGTIFASPSHPSVVPAGIELLQRITARVSVPVLAIGGVNAENAEECRAAGASGVAVISAVLRAEDPRLAAERLRPAGPEEPA